MSFPTTHEFSTKRMFQLATIIFIFGMLIGVAATLIWERTDWWQQLAGQTWTYGTANWWFFPSIVVGTLIGLFIIKKA